MSYKSMADSSSMLNTPSIFPIYVSGLVLRRMQKLGGVQHYEQFNTRKADKLYAAIHEGEEKGLLKARVQEGSRSLMNVVFDVLSDETKFIAGAEAKGMKAIKGHRSVGGIRVSLYNAVTEEQVDAMVAYIREFIET
nr:predicted protein [Mycena chlorophos]